MRLSAGVRSLIRAAPVRKRFSFDHVNRSFGVAARFVVRLLTHTLRSTQVANLLLVVPASALVVDGGCRQPLLIQPASRISAQPGECVWWQVPDRQLAHPPIVGLERRLNQRETEQVVICQGGVRIFRYARGRLTSAGPPLPAQGAPWDIDVVKWVLRSWSAYASAHSATDVSPLPAQSLAALASVADVADLLRTYWAGWEVKPPGSLGYRGLLRELGRAPVGVGELQEASEAL